MLKLNESIPEKYVKIVAAIESGDLVVHDENNRRTYSEKELTVTLDGDVVQIRIDKLDS